MGISKYIETIQKINVFKSYSSLLLPVVIGLVGALLFIPTRLMSSKLKEQITDESIPMGREVKSLSGDAVVHDQWKLEAEHQEVYERDANKVAILARQSTQRELLSNEIFPEPKDTSAMIFEQFGQRFRGAVDELLSRANAVDCPTEAELERSMPGSTGYGWGSGSSYWRLSEASATLRNLICQGKAESGLVYANPTGLSGYEFWGGYSYIGMSEAVEDCWYYQLAYWIIEDVIDTIDTLNSGSSNVFTSPVKRLQGVSFGTGESTFSGVGEPAYDRPSYVLSVAPGQGLTVPCTRRLCDDDIDVVHFDVAVVISTKEILPFMQKLCSAKEHKFKGFLGEGQEQIFKHNQITILESNIWPVNQEGEAHRLYRYGEDAVVELDLICEYIFNKNGYDEIKPESVKETLKGLQVPQY